MVRQSTLLGDVDSTQTMCCFVASECLSSSTDRQLLRHSIGRLSFPNEGKYHPTVHYFEARRVMKNLFPCRLFISHVLTRGTIAIVFRQSSSFGLLILRSLYMAALPLENTQTVWRCFFPPIVSLMFSQLLYHWERLTRRSMRLWLAARGFLLYMFASHRSSSHSPHKDMGLMISIVLRVNPHRAWVVEILQNSGCALP
jgi:hypothetical protein